MLTFAKGKVSETVKATTFGDTNDDNKLNLLDVIRVCRVIVGDDIGQVKDFNCDGSVNISDVLELIRIVVNGGITDKYFAGDFVILVAGNWAGNDFAATETESASVNKAIYDRNKYMLDEYGVNIVTKDVVASGSITGSGVGYEMLYTEYLAGTSEYDAAMIGSKDAISAGYKGFLHIQTVDLSSSVWDQNIVSTPGYALNHERDETYQNGDITTMMNEGRALFWSATLSNYRTLKKGNVGFGIVPFPKYDDSQENYRSRIGTNVQVLCVPETVENFGRTGRVLTLLAEQGKAISDAYRKDAATKNDGSCDTGILEMLDVAIDASVYDFGVINNPASVATLIQRLVYSGETVTSVYDEKQELANIILDRTSKLYYEHADTSVNKNLLRNFERYEEWFEETTSKGIEENRKGDAVITVVDANGSVIEGATVTVVQENHEFRFGANIFMLDELETEEKNEQYKEIFKDTFNMATLPFYWNANEPIQGQTRYDIDSVPMYRRPAIDLCMKFCEENGIEPRLHGLAYAYFFPNWYKNLTDKEEQYNLLEKRMKEIGERYGDRINTIEITNETYRSNSAVEIYNDSDFVEWSFKTAEKYFPNNQLGINESDHIWEAPTIQARYYRQIRDTLASGGRIDAIGMQYHILDSQHDRAWKSSDVFYNPKLSWETLNLYGSFGLPIQITEITIPAYSEDPENEKLQAEILEKVCRIWFSHPNVEQIIYWNLVDGYAHGAKQGDMTKGENVYFGGLLRFDMTPKPAYYTFKNLFEKEWHTEEEVVTDAEGFALFKGFYGDYTVKVEVNGTVTEQKIKLSKEHYNVYKFEI